VLRYRPHTDGNDLLRERLKELAGQHRPTATGCCTTGCAMRAGRSKSTAVCGASLQQGLHIQSGTVANTPSGGSMWSMAVTMSPRDIEALKDVNAGPMATCVWLEGPTGMMSTPDLIQFMA
jgi:hypothetical protein